MPGNYGPRGEDGAAGINGIDGLPGLPGTKGNRGDPGSAILFGELGVDGDEGKAIFKNSYCSQFLISQQQDILVKLVTLALSDKSDCEDLLVLRAEKEYSEMLEPPVYTVSEETKVLAVILFM